MIMVAPWTIHRNPTLWRDADRFDPDRFMPWTGAETRPGSYIPFPRAPHLRRRRLRHDRKRADPRAPGTPLRSDACRIPAATAGGAPDDAARPRDHVPRAAAPGP